MKLSLALALAALSAATATSGVVALETASYSILRDAKDGSPTCTPGKTIGLASLKPAFVSTLKASAGVAPFALSENGGTAGAVVQTTFVTSTTSSHVDHLPPDEDGIRRPIPEGDLVTLVPLETNDDAHFEVDAKCYSIKKGRSIHFKGGLPHRTVVESGSVSLLGPFHTRTMTNVGAGNDECTTAFEVDVPSTSFGSTSGASPQPAGFCSAGLGGSAASWYKVTGTGNLMTATTCAAGTGYDTALSILCNGCDEPTCVGTNDDACFAHSFLSSTVNWCGEDGVEYNIMVHGFASGSQGPFELDISDNGSPCTPPPELQCISPIIAPIDIKFCSDPNGFNCKAKGKGVLPMTVFGTEELDVTLINVTTAELCLVGEGAPCISASSDGTDSLREYAIRDRGDPLVHLGASDSVCGTDEELIIPDGILDLELAWEANDVKAILLQGCDELCDGAAGPTFVFRAETTEDIPVKSIPANDDAIDQLFIQNGAVSDCKPGNKPPKVPEQSNLCARAFDECELNDKYPLCKCAIVAGNSCEWDRDSKTCVSL